MRGCCLKVEENRLHLSQGGGPETEAWEPYEVDIKDVRGRNMYGLAMLVGWLWAAEGEAWL